MKTLAEAITDNHKVADHIARHPGEYPHQFSGLSQTIAGVHCVIYSSGCISTGDCHLPSDALAESRKAVSDAYDRNRQIIELAKRYAIDNAKTLTPKLYTHNGRKFVRL